ncbi:UDP-glucose 4-epimerase [Clostridium homopropionicum DSM 5847]|uniref:UDP-glucose 4-epimerase n=1 Tax=Clostridium homopropionicum DSM 5847 TaxID=1121318 RepID=A0A0L6ZCG6_9CLOT|nr:NAD-dependent epimerase/dehydratase family protein [Clostridium homopropionicum]KOA20674.1 UDP-glucose 4-epimerase [Clostridium homopropionicum DSM 5847]SFF91762.1 UDP-glucose 4-epimerase [Clostridium homopropionicum]
MKILVTGGAGFIGSNLVDKLVQLKHEVIIVDNLSSGKKENLNNNCIFYNLDILDKNLFKVVEKENPSVVFHLAAQVDVGKSFINPYEDAMTNVLGTINILEACRKYRVRKIIFASSAAVYGIPQYLGLDEKHITKPISFYGYSKLTSENYIQMYSNAYELDYSILRYANVYGTRQNYNGEGGVIAIFINKVLNAEIPHIYGDGNQNRDFIYVDDVVNANISAINKGSKTILNIGTGKSTSINELYEIIKVSMNTEITPIYMEERKGDIKESYFNVSLANVNLGWNSKYPLNIGIEKTISYYLRRKYTELNA